MSVFMSVADGQGAVVVNSLCSIMCFFFGEILMIFFTKVAKRKMEMLFVRGDGVILVLFCFIKFLFLAFFY